ncbi:hypothetical protein TS85_03265 [Sphingomonas hengshuiensis]|uniref:EF-hand domain-containing protein n=1 Tax=Sphingomonas hengshuiensis TaxID=1609977 RepID=A0A7U5BFC2_9SPHN|nr:hypothetical protein TS85_03265 [Sphingomonas hengshuiensis]
MDDAAAQPAADSAPMPNSSTAPAAEATQPTPSAATPDASATAGTTGAGAATSTAATPAASPDQVSQAIGRDFGTYDADANGALNQAEFGTWVSALRKASEPTFAPGSPEAQTWVGQAFAATDTDKNQSVTKEELTTFLTPKAQ